MSDPWWSVACMVGFWGWVLSTIGLIIQGLPRRGAINGRIAARWGGAVLLLYLLWVVSMLKA